MFLPTYPDIHDFYNYLTHHIVPGPQSLSYFLPVLVLPTALLIPPSILSQRQLYSLFLPPIFASIWHASLCIGGLDVLSVTFGLWSFALLGWHDVRGEFKRVRVRRSLQENGTFREEVAAEEKEGMTRFEEERYPERFGWRRIHWVFTLLVSLRFNGWKIGEGKHDRSQPAQGISRGEFVKHVYGFLVLDLLIFDLTSMYVRYDPYFYTSGINITSPFPANTVPTIFRAFPPQFIRSSILAAQVFSCVSAMFYIATPLAVGVNWLGLIPDEWSPHAWPTFFGSFPAVWTSGLRGLWGTWWHQTNREICSTPAKAVADKLKLPGGSTSRYACLVTLTFFFSGVLHTGLIPPAPLSGSLTANQMRLHVAGFFWAQIPGFAIEMVVSKFVAWAAPSCKHWMLSKLVVLVWTASWLCLTLPLLTVPFRELGYWSIFRIHQSVLHRLYRSFQ